MTVFEPVSSELRICVFGWLLSKPCARNTHIYDVFDLFLNAMVMLSCFRVKCEIAQMLCLSRF